MMNNDFAVFILSHGRASNVKTYQTLINQGQTQKNKGGLTEMYLDSGTYVKSFYSVMYSPSCVKVAAMGDKHMRMHHRVNWDCCTPKILNQRWKKSKGG